MDLSRLSPASKLLLIMNMAIGGGVGSTAGGIKILRLLIVIHLVWVLLRKACASMHAVIKPRLAGRRMEETEIQEALLLILLFGTITLFSWLPFLFMGYNPMDSLFEVVSAMATVGLSAGVVSSEMPNLLKGILCINMLLGRLEILAWLVMVYPRTAAEKEDISLDHIMKAVGNRSFGTLLLLAGLIVIVPILGDIPGVPTAVALVIILIAGQLIIRRDHFWLPGWLLSRSVKQVQLVKILRWVRPAARFLDRWTKPRWVFLTKGGGTYIVALTCMVIALAMPPMEVIPFSANGAGIALIAFGLALITHDGLAAVLALVSTIGTFTLVFYNLF